MLRKNVAGQKVHFSLFKSGARIANPTMAAGDFKVDIDDAGQANVATLPTSDAAGKVTWLPSQPETNGDYITFLANDVAGAEWEPLTIEFDTRLESIVAAAVWSYTSRTLTSLSTLVASIAAAVWGYAIRTITGGGGSAAEVWTYTSRTLTQTAAQVVSAVSGSELNIGISTTFDATITGLSIPATWTKVYFTVKKTKTLADAQAEIKIVESNPAAGTDGLLILKGATATSAAWGELTVDQVNGTVQIELIDEATALLREMGSLYYDIKVLLADGSSQQLTEGSANISHVVTRATS